MKRIDRILSVFVLLILGCSGCNKDNYWKPIEPQIYLNYTDAKGVFICNEGNFMYGNASLAFYNDEVYNCDSDIFYKTNGFPLGDVCQSMTIWNDRGYIVMNNSGKVFVVDVNTMVYIGAIRGLVSPRYVKIISAEKAYVSDLYAPFITVFNPQSLEKIGTIHLGAHNSVGRVNGSEMMAQWENFVYTNSWSYNNKIYKIDTHRDKVVDSLVVGNQPNSLTVDCNGKLWILSGGGYEGSPMGHQFAELAKIDAETLTSEQVWKFDDIDTSPCELTVNPKGDTLLYINSKNSSSSTLRNGGIFAMSVTAEELPLEALIDNADRLIYGLGIDPQSGEIYISDAIDYVQNGTIYRYSPKGVLIDSFKTGIIPGAFCFKGM